MQSIVLTEDHKSKLLEMCKELFPNDKVNFIRNGIINFLINYHEKSDINNSKATFTNWDKTESIHWFEFCMTHLPLKIYYKKNEKGGMNLEIITKNLLRFEDFGRYEINPIDYLYKKFKELKDE